MSGHSAENDALAETVRVCRPLQWPTKFSCVECREEYVIAGDDLDAVLAEWGTCPECFPISRGAAGGRATGPTAAPSLGEESGAAPDADPDAPETRPGRQAAGSQPADKSEGLDDAGPVPCCCSPRRLPVATQDSGAPDAIADQPPGAARASERRARRISLPTGVPRWVLRRMAI